MSLLAAGGVGRVKRDRARPQDPAVQLVLLDEVIDDIDPRP